MSCFYWHQWLNLTRNRFPSVPVLHGQRETKAGLARTTISLKIILSGGIDHTTTTHINTQHTCITYSENTRSLISAGFMLKTTKNSPLEELTELESESKRQQDLVKNKNGTH